MNPPVQNFKQTQNYHYYIGKNPQGQHVKSNDPAKMNPTNDRRKKRGGWLLGLTNAGATEGKDDFAQPANKVTFCSYSPNINIV